MSRLWGAFALVCLCFVPGVRADERILSFDSEITVHPDGKLSVRETLRVRAEGKQIRRGIFRDFPTIYPRQGGGQVQVGFEFRAAARDGASEPWRAERRGNGVRVYLGNPNVMLPRGEHVYVLSYDTDRQMGYFADHDELYWNATGNGWDFAIDRATARVLLPEAIPRGEVKLEAYTGPQGAKGAAYTASIDNGQPLFVTTRGLAPREALTIVAMWPKGFIMPAVEAEGPRAPAAAATPYPQYQDPRAGWAPLEHLLGRRFAGTHAPLFAAIAGLLALLGFYYWIWNRVGRDPPGKVVIPEYEAPQGFSAAAMRYIHEWGYDVTGFAAAVLSLAVKGYLRLEEEDGFLGFGTTYTLVKLEPPAPGAKELSPDEAELLRQVFRSGSKLELKQSNHARVRAALSAHESALDQRYSKGYFAHNAGWVFLGVLITVVAGAVVIMLPGTADTWPDYFLGHPAGWASLMLLFAMVVMIFVFGWLLRAPSVLGRAAMDRIAGFRMYLEVAEGEELKKLDKPPPPLTPQLFEAYLPMALALGVEQRWAERFAAAFHVTDPAGAYVPIWYTGANFNPQNIAGFSSRMGSSLASAIASSSTAPGTKSGGGGRGSSGGGGGGGGGGGW